MHAPGWRVHVANPPALVLLSVVLFREERRRKPGSGPRERVAMHARPSVHCVTQWLVQYRRDVRTIHLEHQLCYREQLFTCLPQLVADGLSRGGRLQYVEQFVQCAKQAVQCVGQRGVARLAGRIPRLLELRLHFANRVLKVAHGHGDLPFREIGWMVQDTEQSIWPLLLCCAEGGSSERDKWPTHLAVPPVSSAMSQRTDTHKGTAYGDEPEPGHLPTRVRVDFLIDG
ncbi:hypothetical protein [Ktedonospora formicarum]|uniref:hypothetical protein n=1 Tax=Ktedonospora formicarum TaxID=2778364 RepID=UPI001C691E2F|nr:hypothetical protein [Ktedonospora formicarum]